MAATSYDKAIGRRLKALREARQWSGEELAARCPGAIITPSQISKLERGVQQFTAMWLYRLSEALECPLIELLEDSPIGVGARGLAGRINELAEPDQEAVHRIVDAMARRAKPRVKSKKRTARPPPELRRKLS